MIGVDPINCVIVHDKHNGRIRRRIYVTKLNYPKLSLTLQ